MTMTSCTPNRVVPIIHFHSYLDTHIPYDGGIGSGPSNHYNPPIDSVLNVWASNNSCGILNDTIINNAQYTLTKWTDCDCETEIHCYITQDGGHSWPGVGGSAYINATDLMWTFFQQYSLDCNPTFIANENRQESKIKIYPNPTNNIIKIQPYINWKNIKISVFSPQGQEILRSIDQTKVDISNLSNGLLLMKIELDDTVEMHIILKTK